MGHMRDGCYEEAGIRRPNCYILETCSLNPHAASGKCDGISHDAFQLMAVAIL